MPSISLSMFRLHIIIVIYFTIILNWPVYTHMATILINLEHVKLGFIITIPLLLFAALNLVFLPFSLRFVQKPFFILMLLTGSLASYGILKYGVLFDPDMVRNIIETNPAEAKSYLNVSSITWFLLTGLLPAALLLFTRIEQPKPWWRGTVQRLMGVALSVVMVVGIGALYYQDYASVSRNNRSLKNELIPSSYVYSSWKLFRDRYLKTQEPYRQIGTDAHQITQAKGKKTNLVVLGCGGDSSCHELLP